MNRRDFALSVFCCLWFVIGSGCGQTQMSDMPALAQVSGVVTLDGKPLEGAIVVFEPAAGAMSTGATDAAGNYKLIYSATANGAVLGEHTVRFSKLQSDAGMETLPARFNEKSALKATVADGENTLNFDLETKPAKGPKK